MKKLLGGVASGDECICCHRAGTIYAIKYWRGFERFSEDPEFDPDRQLVRQKWLRYRLTEVWEDCHTGIWDDDAEIVITRTKVTEHVLPRWGYQSEWTRVTITGEWSVENSSWFEQDTYDGCGNFTADYSEPYQDWAQTSWPSVVPAESQFNATESAPCQFHDATEAWINEAGTKMVETDAANNYTATHELMEPYSLEDALEDAEKMLRWKSYEEKAKFLDEDNSGPVLIRTIEEDFVGRGLDDRTFVYDTTLCDQKEDLTWEQVQKYTCKKVDRTKDDTPSGDAQALRHWVDSGYGIFTITLAKSKWLGDGTPTIWVDGRCYPEKTANHIPILDDPDMLSTSFDRLASDLPSVVTVEPSKSKPTGLSVDDLDCGEEDPIQGQIIFPDAAQ